MKTVLALENASIPPVVGFHTLNPNINLENGLIEIVTKRTTWPKRNRPRRASVNSFGYGGANAHTIIESVDSFGPQYQSKLSNIAERISTSSCVQTYRSHLEGLTNGDGEIQSPTTAEDIGENTTSGRVTGRSSTDIHYANIKKCSDDHPVSFDRARTRSQYLIVFSAHNKRTLERNIAALRSVKGWRTHDLAYTLSQRRSMFRHRAFGISENALLDGTTIPENVHMHKLEKSRPPNICFIMTGQGAQWTKMGLDLYKTFSVYRKTIRDLNGYLQELENKPSWTIEGEIAAAYAAGILTARNAIVNAYLRGWTVSHNRVSGSMLAVGVAEEVIVNMLKDNYPRLSIACYNGPENFTISGDKDEILMVKRELENKQKFVRELATDGNAYHSSHMRFVGHEYEKEIMRSHAETPVQDGLETIPFVSSVTTERMSSSQIQAPYWRSNLESPVLFDQAIHQIVKNYEIDIMIEIGPHSALRSPLKQKAQAMPDIDFPTYLPSLIKHTNGISNMLNVAGTLFTRGQALDFLQINETENEQNDDHSVGHRSIIVDLPHYQWQYDSPLFNENRWTREWRLRSHPRHDLLGSRIPGGSDNQPTWRNILRTKDVHWLQDHCVGHEVVFPAVGYISMAIEAATQAFEIKGGDADLIEAFEIQDMIIKAALILPSPADGVELLLTLNLLRWVDTQPPGLIYQFVITSVTDLGQAQSFVEHATGRLEVGLCKVQIAIILVQKTEILKRISYLVLVDQHQILYEKVAMLYPPVQANIWSHLDDLASEQIMQFYITFQTFFKNGSTVPHLQKFLDWMEAKVKAKLGSNAAILETSAAHVLSRAASIRSHANELSQGSSECRIMCHMYQNLPSIFRGEITGIQAALQNNLLDDLYENGQLLSEGNRRLGHIVELLAHKSPSMKIFEIGAGTGSATKEVLRVLKGDTDSRMYLDYTYTDITTSFLGRAEQKFANFHAVTYATFDMEKSSSQQGFEDNYDLIFASNAVHATSNIVETLKNIRNLLQPGGKLVLLEVMSSSLSAGLILGTFSDFWKADVDTNFPRHEGPFLSKQMWKEALPQAGFSGIDLLLDDFLDHTSSSVLVATAVISVPQPCLLPSIPGQGLTVIYRGDGSPIVNAYRDFLRSRGCQVDLRSLSDPSLDKSQQQIFLVEINVPLFDRITSAEWRGLQIALEHAKSVLWVTNGGLLDGKRPLFAMIQGILRGLKTERPQLRISTIDLDLDNDQFTNSTFDLISQLQVQSLDDSKKYEDWEYRQKSGITYISRLLADGELNASSYAKTQPVHTTETMRYSHCQKTPIQLCIDRNYRYFRGTSDFFVPLQNDEVEVEVKAVSLSNKLTGTVPGVPEPTGSGSGFVGVVKATSPNVKNLSRETAELATLPVAFCTAVHALMGLARLESQETILIQASASGLGLAAIQIATYCGAKIFVSVRSSNDKRAILQLNLGIQENNVLTSDECSLPRALLHQNGGKGANVIFVCSPGKSRQDSSYCLAEFGRLIEVATSTDTRIDQTLVNVSRCHGSFFAFNIETISHQKPSIIANVMKTVHDLWVQKAIKPITARTINVSEVDELSAPTEDWLEFKQQVLTFEDHNAVVKVQNFRMDRKLDSDASYMLVGGLGGLGRHMANHLAARGARNIVFLSRSGDQNIRAQKFLGRLNEKGVATSVIKGDVTSAKDVNRAVAMCARPIKGVIQGALTLRDNLFEKMTLDDFNTTVKPRVQGTLNLHNALQNAPLDFFVTWSSWTSIFGTLAQTNYLASNAFMDAFACHRRTLGSPATSLSLSQILDVGIASDVHHYQIALDGKGLYATGEDRFLEFCDSAIAQCNSPVFRDTTRSCRELDEDILRGHLLAGIEPKGLSDLDKSMPLSDMAWYWDRRFSALLLAIQIVNKASSNGNAATRSACEADCLDTATQVHQKVARLLYIPQEDVETSMPITNYGIDSMIAAELRNWLLERFQADVSTLTLLGPKTSVKSIVQSIGVE
ncbi:MAG: hypothetical protein Q9191_003380 [Dirinaria sp. TL-2023a]